MKEYLFKKGIHECCYRSKSGGNRRGAMPVPTMQLKKGLPLFPLKICHRGFSFFSVLFGRNDISRLTVKEFLSSVPMRISAHPSASRKRHSIHKALSPPHGFLLTSAPPRFKYETLAIRRGRTFYTSHRIVLEPPPPPHPDLPLFIRPLYYCRAYRHITAPGRSRNTTQRSGRAHVPSVVRYHRTSSRMYAQVQPRDVEDGPSGWWALWPAWP